MTWPNGSVLASVAEEPRSVIRVLDVVSGGSGGSIHLTGDLSEAQDHDGAGSC